MMSAKEKRYWKTIGDAMAVKHRRPLRRSMNAVLDFLSRPLPFKSRKKIIPRGLDAVAFYERARRLGMTR